MNQPARTLKAPAAAERPTSRRRWPQKVRIPAIAGALIVAVVVGTVLIQGGRVKNIPDT